MNEFIQNNRQLLFILASLWTLPWKGFALWKAARKNDRWWFIAMLLVNLLGLLEILYIFYFSKLPQKKAVQKP